MILFRKRFVLFLSGLLTLIMLVSAIHFLVFPEETRAILIDFSKFKKQGDLYVNSHIPQHKIDTLTNILTIASARVDSFWGKKTCKPKFIYCENDSVFQKYSGKWITPAATKCKLGSYIIIGNEGIDVDILAHEICHAELYERIGFFKYSFNIPTWFNEGLAMQVDTRNYYSEDTLKVRSHNYQNMPDVHSLKTMNSFYNGSEETIMLNYMAAKHEVHHWYTKEKFATLLQKLQAGESFDSAFE